MWQLPSLLCSWRPFQTVFFACKEPSAFSQWGGHGSAVSPGRARRQGSPSRPLSLHRKAGARYERQVAALQRFRPDRDGHRPLTCGDLGNQSQLGNLRSRLRQRVTSSALFKNGISLRKVHDHLKRCYFTNTQWPAFLTFSLHFLWDSKDKMICITPGLRFKVRFECLCFSEFISGPKHY